MVNLKKRFIDFEESGAFCSLVNISSFAGKAAFHTKDGFAGLVIGIKTEDVECREAKDINALTAALRSALRVFGDRFTVSSHLLKHSNPVIDIGPSADPLVESVRANYLNELKRRGDQLFSFEQYLIITRKPEWKTPDLATRLISLIQNPAQAFRRASSREHELRSLDSELKAELRALNQATDSFLEQIRDQVEARVLDRTEAFQVFRKMLNPDLVKAGAVKCPESGPVDYLLVDSELECYRDHLRLDNYFVKSLTLKQLPRHSFANMFAALGRVKANLLITTEWTVQNSTKSLGDLRSKRRHWHNTKTGVLSQIGSERPNERDLLYDESKEGLVAEMGECLTAIEMGGTQLGEFSLTVVVFAASLEEAERAAADVMKVVGAHDGAMNEERYNGLNSFLAAMPAGHPYNLRKLIVTDQNHADMIPWFQPSEGKRRSEFLQASSLTVFETEDNSLFYFNPHVQDVGHTLILGPTGGGKSFLLNFLIAHAQQYDPRTFIFDVGGSYRWLTTLFGGTIVQFRPEQRSFSINPFCLEPTQANLEFLFELSKILVESGGHKMNDSEERDLFESIRSLYVLDPEHRRLLTLSTTVSRVVGNHLKRWTEGEQYGQWFDNVRDDVTFSKFQCIDFEGMERLGTVLEPLMFYLLHRANEVVYDEALSTTFKLAVVDEAWLFLKHPVTRAYITTGMRTWRKKNAAMILSTQSLGDLSDANDLRPVIDNCPTKLLLSNPTLDAAFYGEVLRLNSVELGKVRTIAAKRQFLMKREALSKVLSLNVDPKSYWLFTTNPYEAKRRKEIVDQVGLEAALEVLARGSR